MRKHLPLGKRVIIDVLPAEETKTESGIVTQAADHLGFQIKRLRGVVQSVGAGVTHVKIGETVVFEEGAGVPLEFLKPDTVWVEEEQIVAIEIEE